MGDSNHRRHCQQIYSLSPLATREIPQIYGYSIGAALPQALNGKAVRLMVQLPARRVVRRDRQDRVPQGGGKKRFRISCKYKQIFSESIHGCNEIVHGYT